MSEQEIMQKLRDNPSLEQVIETKKNAESQHFNLSELKAFKKEWDKAVDVLKKSGADLSKILISKGDY